MSSGVWDPSPAQPSPTHAENLSLFGGKDACLRKFGGPALCRGMNKGWPIRGKPHLSLPR